MKRDPATLLVTILAVVRLAAQVLAGSPVQRHTAGGERGSSRLGDHRTDAPRSARPPPGREAATPSEIPARGWWDIMKRVVNDISERRLMTEAAGVTFYALLSLFPALAALISIYGLFADPRTVGDQLQSLSGVVPGGGMDIISAQVHSLTDHGAGALSVGAVIGILTSLWSSNQATKGLFDALNVVYDEKEKRGFVLRTVITLAFTLASLLFVVVAIAAVIAVPIVLNVIGLGGVAATLLNLLRWPLLLVFVALLLACLYRIGPSRQRARWRWLTWGSCFAAVAWVIVSLAFSWYVSSFGSYNKTYGSLGAVIGFMTWIWLSALVVLIGGDINAEMELQTARDTTTGPEQPRGTRGATRADEVAA
jgi:membrane protein